MLHNKPSMSLNYILRYSNHPLDKPETVAEHIAGMQLFAIELYNEFLKRDLSFDIKEVCYRITIHDLDECILGDIPRDVKYYNNEIHEYIEFISNNELCKNYESKIVEDVVNAKDESFEGKIVNMLDSIQAVYKIKLANLTSNVYNNILEQAIITAKMKVYNLFSSDDQKDILCRELFLEDIEGTDLQYK